MTTSRYTIILEPAEEGGYNVSVPSLPGCVTQGATVDEAVLMAKDAIGLWIEELAAQDLPIPNDDAGAGVQLVMVDVATSTSA